MEIIITDERDERFIEFCDSFGCYLDEPQVVLLLNDFKKTVGCASFNVYDSQSAEITTLFLNSRNQWYAHAHWLLSHCHVAAHEFLQISCQREGKGILYQSRQ